MDNGKDLATYEQLVSDMFHSVTPAIGVHVMLLVIERALWEVKHKHESAALITYSEEGISLRGLAALEPEKAGAIAHDLIMGIARTLGLLVGKQLARQLTEQLRITNREG